MLFFMTLLIGKVFFLNGGVFMKRKVIIDCDPGIDDSLALMLALSSDEIEVIGITIVCGNSPVEMGFENAKKILAHMQRLDIPIFVGADKPLKKTFCDALDTHGADGLGESFLKDIPGYHQTMDAVTFLSKTLKKQSCSIIALGPLTNLAQLISQDVEAFDKIEQLVSMGGSYKSHGNCSPVAEYNYWEDPEAARLVYQQMAKTKKQIHMVGLDVTRKIVLTPNLLSYMERLHPEKGAFIRKITKNINMISICNCIIPVLFHCLMHLLQIIKRTGIKIRSRFCHILME